MTLPILKVPGRRGRSEVRRDAAVAEDSQMIRIRIAWTHVIIDFNGQALADPVVTQSTARESKRIGADALNNKRHTVRAVRAMHAEDKPGRHGGVRADCFWSGEECRTDLIRNAGSETQYRGGNRRIAIQG